jgi:ligand-binding sensor domain-containing protein
MKTRHWICGMAIAFLPCMSLAQETPGLVPALDWSTSQQGGFPTSIAMDAQNSVWVGTEDKGVWRYDAGTKTWTQFTTKDGLGDDNIYAVAVDKLNRVWVGHLNHGVSVWNGEKWKNYGILDGPLGDRVYAIATCPKDGDVWIATDCGRGALFAREGRLGLFHARGRAALQPDPGHRF